MLKGIYYKDYLVSRVLSQGKLVDGYDRVYYQTNEDLKEPLKNINFKGNDVLTVLASSDHVFTSRFLGARKTDAFDFNRLTIYYYYFRKWTIKYMQELLPDVWNTKWIKDCLSKVKPESQMEALALEYYKNHVKDHTNFVNLFYDMDAQPEGHTIYTHYSDLEPYVDEPLNFKHMNLFVPQEPDKTYDIAMVSNVFDWARGDEHKLKVARNNLYKLLNRDGIVICSNIVSRDLKQEERIFEDGFEKLVIPVSQSYIYVKK